MEKIYNYLSSNNKFKVLNIFLSVLSFFYLYQNFSTGITEIKFEKFYFLFILLVVSMNIFLAISWSYLYYDKFSFQIISTWLISGVGKYVPFKIGLISKRYVYSKIYKTNNSFSKYFFYEIIYNFGLFALLSILGLSKYRNYYFFILFISILIFKNRLNLKVIFSYLSAYIFNFTALSLFYFNINSEFDLLFSFNYILVSIIGNLFIGAPAGIGIRETLLMNNPLYVYSDVQFFSILIILRILFIISDICSYFIGLLISKLAKS